MNVLQSARGRYGISPEESGATYTYMENLLLLYYYLMLTITWFDPLLSDCSSSCLKY